MCLVNCLYKIIPKILAARLKVVIEKIVSKNQFVFVRSRQILDRVLGIWIPYN